MSRVVLVATASAEDEEGAARALDRLGASVAAQGLFDEPPDRVVTGASFVRAIVVEAGDRPDLAVASLRGLRRVAALTETPSLLAIAERQVARIEPSIGFDDFIVAPYFPAELYARIRRLEWRASEFLTEERLKLGAILVDRAAREVTVDGRRVALTAKEFSLLVCLVQARGRVLSRDTLLARVWGARYEGGARTVDIHVRRLRAKLGEALPLETSRGAGYKIAAFEGGT